MGLYPLLITTWKQASHWRNSVTVYNHAIRVTDKKYPNRTVIHDNLSITLFADQKNGEAISHYKIAIELNPKYTNAHYNFGYALFQKGKLREVIQHYFRETLRLKPDYVAAHGHLEIALLQAQELIKNWVCCRSLYLKMNWACLVLI